MRTSDFEYELPEGAIAQEPWPVRDECKLLVMERATGALEDRVFRDIVDYVQPGDVLVANETRVLPARLLGTKRGTGGAAEVFLLREVLGREAHSAHSAVWEALVRPGKRLKPGAVVDFYGPSEPLGTVLFGSEYDDHLTTVEPEPKRTVPNGTLEPKRTVPNGSDGMPDTSPSTTSPILSAEVLDFKEGGKGERVVRLSTPLASLDEALHAVGHTPLPPYIHGYAGDEEMYQTVYAKAETSAAAPTAGLHFTPELIAKLQDKGILWKTVELQVGIDTFRIVEEDDPANHAMHTETYSVPQDVVDACNAAHAAGKRVIAVGTTSVRSLESAWEATATGDGSPWFDESMPQGFQVAQTKENRPQWHQQHAGAAGKLVARENASTNLFLTPGSTFHVVDGIITNFHVPRSTLLMLVSAFSTREHIMAAYKHALAHDYRFLSFGDAMFIK